MARSLKKGPYVDLKLVKKVRKLEETGKHTPIKTWARNSMIVPEFVGFTFNVHNGKGVCAGVCDREYGGT